MSQSNLQELFRDRRKLIETLVPIENKDRQLVPFILNPIQTDMFESSLWRDVYVKPAQVGGTSLIMCDFLLDCLTFKGTTAVIISYDEFITGRLLRKAQAFYDNMAMSIPSLPKLHHKSKEEKTFIFEDSLGVKRGESSFYIASAKGFAMPRGEPIHDLLLDELAFWPQETKTPTVVEKGSAAERVFAAALNRVPLLPGTKVRALSTPNGEDNDFYEMYAAAKEGKAVGKSVFKHHFYPWFIMPEYSMTADSEFCLPGDDTPFLQNLDTSETTLMLRFQQLGIDVLEANNKLRWRRYKIAEMQSLRRSGDTRLLFIQEFPEDDVTCFQSAGDMWYDHNVVSEMAKGCYEAPHHNDFMDIWELPQEGQSYIVAVDPGEGKKSLSVATAWKVVGNSMKHCGTLAGLYDQSTMAEKSKKFARFYNEATLAVEDALGFVGFVKDYPSLYYRTDPDTEIVSQNIGWQTTVSTKPFMCNEVARVLPTVECHDIRIVEQLRNIKEQKSRGKLIPVSVGADDFFMSFAIAVVCRHAIPFERGFVGAKGWTNTWGR